jgi:Ala-tRNA(Pro) deacylase
MKDRADLFALLDRHGIDHATCEHPAVFRVGEGEAVKAAIPGAHTKNLFLKDAKRRLWLVSALDTAVIDLKTLHHTIGAARLSFGSPDLLLGTLGVRPGSVSLIKAKAATTSLTRPGFRRFLEIIGVAPIIVDFARPAEA